MDQAVLIIGNGACARALAENFQRNRIDVIRVVGDADADAAVSGDRNAPAAKNRQVQTATDLIACSGTAGNFKILLRKDQEQIARSAAAIIIAEENRRCPDYALYQLAPGPAIITLTECDRLFSDPQPALTGIKQVVFLAGLVQEGYPAVTEKIMRLCLRLQLELNVQTYVFSRNLKVAGPGLETLYWQSKKAGTIYVKFTHSRPQIRPAENGAAMFAFEDELTGHLYELTPNLTVVDETLRPGAHLAQLAAVLKLDTGPQGFVQTDNVRRTGVFTNRKGIMAAGPSRGIPLQPDCPADADGAVLAAMQWAIAAAAEPAGQAVIDPGRCIRCLTCYRICPHGAITLNTRPAVAPGSCENCGLCVSQCPRQAISAGVRTIRNQIENPRPHCADVFEPHLLVVCCSRSAIPAWNLSRLWGRPQPERLSVISVPCGAGVSRELIYRAFQDGADGVLILTCHEGNCHSEKGNGQALQEGARIREFFEQTGFEAERLSVSTLAANMGFEFSENLAHFADTIRRLGPSRLRYGKDPDPEELLV